jgi:exodeoxyribonuclease VII small subunit
MSTPDDVPFEELVQRLEALVERLEGKELPLEDALAAYQEGVELARLGHHRLEAAERRLEELSGDGKLVERAATVEPEDEP